MIMDEFSVAVNLECLLRHLYRSNTRFLLCEQSGS
jgi:hypothetical protein